MRNDPNGEFFFTILGGAIGYAVGYATAVLTHVEKSKRSEVAEAAAFGGMIAGAGVDIGLLVLGSGGTAAPLVACSIAYVAGGVGNLYTTDKTSKITKGVGTTNDEKIGAFILGGSFNLISFGLGTGGQVKCLIDLFDQGLSALGENLGYGFLTAANTTIATSISTSSAQNSSGDNHRLHTRPR